jgi:hypothetical protein
MEILLIMLLALGISNITEKSNKKVLSNGGIKTQTTPIEAFNKKKEHGLMKIPGQKIINENGNWIVVDSKYEIKQINNKISDIKTIKLPNGILIEEGL